MGKVRPGENPCKPEELLICQSCNGRGSVTEKEGCFIATTVFGTSAAPEVVALRRYRDQVLKENISGRAAISTYYRVGPALAVWLKDKPYLISLVRRALTFFIKRLKP
jgi:hypothetical protein